MDSQAVMAGTHDQNVEMNVQTTRKLRGVNSVDLNKTALRIPVPGTSVLAFGCTIAAGTVDRASATADRWQSFGSGPFYTEHHVDSAKPET